MEDRDAATLKGVGLIVAVLAAGVLIYRFAAPPEPAPAPAPPSAPAAQAQPAAPAAPAAGLPPLEDSDLLVRARAAALSRDARFAAWLKHGDLIARLTASANIVAAGKVPSDALAFLAPAAKFPVRRRGGRLEMDPRGYARYDGFASAVASVDADAAARLFLDLKPLFQKAWESLGERGGDATGVFLRAAAEVGAAPVLTGPVELVPAKKGIVYAYADPSLEALSPARKQVLRMGPKNAAKVQAKLKAIAAALEAGGPR